jgi:NAD(P)-dependent dehydrogenase (short-subunit alcohol dehydrogenase family)
MKIAGTVALVTGGASGLGAATVRELLAQGGKAMIVDRPQSDGAKLAAELGANAAFVAADVTSDAEVTAAVQQTMETFGAIHINVNCAGTGAAMKTTGKGGPMPLEIFAKVIEINHRHLQRAAAVRDADDEERANADGERGVIVNTASVAAFDGQIGQAAYSASRAASSR